MFWWRLNFLLIAIFDIIYALPYNPTTVLISSNSTAIYLFSPTDDGTTSQLSIINLTSTISTSKNEGLIIASTLPFIPHPTSSLIVSIDSQDKIYLVSGDCTDGANGAKLYTIIPSDSNPDWTQVPVDTNGIENPAANGGINLLSRLIQFNNDMYMFGGMCPNSSTLTVENWQRSATYSNTLLSMSKDGKMGRIATRGPPVAEAGFSITPLSAAYINNSSNVPSQQNFVLIGGQTQSAFINMSQVALLSLPEESWSFADVSTISASIDPRSGHTAALSIDGKKIFVFGGWVGDINTPAEPNLLILNIGSSYGGSGDWSWSIPDQSGTAPNLYGHSMVYLPGDVLMISGGYALPTPSKIKTRDVTSNTATYLFNTTSNNWITTYTNPNTQPVPTQGSSDNRTKFGLGIGLGLGLGLLLLLGLCLWFGRRKIREHRRDRDRRLLQQSMNAANGPQPTQWMMERNHTGDPYPWAPIQGDTNAVRQTSQAERTGLSFEVPSPTRGLRRSLHSRPNTHRYEDVNRSRAPGHIHTIAESDENERVSGMIEEDIVSSAPILDPFQDPQHILDRRSPSPTSPTQERENEMQHWYKDWAEAERQQQKTGRVSPNKSDRTGSSISDSTESAVSALSYQPSVRRANSKRSTPQISPPDSPTMISKSTTHRRKRSKSFGFTSKPQTTASTQQYFSKLQSEAQTLLLGTGPGLGAGARAQSTNTATSNSHQPRPKSILQSFKRVLGGGDRMSTSNPAPERSATTAGTLHLNRRGQAIPQPNPPQRSASLGTETIYTRRRQGAQDWNEHNTAPISWPANLARGDSSRAHNGGGVGDISSEISTGGGGASAALTDDDDWDVESAVERRVVQVMFTVPRGSLRVVNAGPDPDPELDLDLDSDERGTGDGVVVVDKGKGKGRDMDR